MVVADRATDRVKPTGEEPMMSGSKNLLSVVALLGVLWLGAPHLLAQEVVGGEGAVPAPTPAPGQPIDPESLMSVLYILVAAVAVVAAVATIFLAMGMDRARGRELTEGERRLGRMLSETKTEFQEGREEARRPG